MRRLEVSCAVRLIYTSLGVKGLKIEQRDARKDEVHSDVTQALKFQTLTLSLSTGVMSEFLFYW